MTEAADHVFDLILGRWRSQTVYAGVELGVFDVIRDYPKHAVELADQLDIDRDAGYRLLRALSSLGLLEETSDQRFSLTSAGELLQSDHPKSLRGVALFEEGPTHYAIWKHLPEIVRDGGPNGFHREFGHSVVDHLEADPDYAARFNASMTSLSRSESAWVETLLADVDLSAFGQVCDVGGGHGHLLCTLLQDEPSVEGTVLERPAVVEDRDRHWHDPMDLADRVEFVPGDFFEAVPPADAYLLKHILHGWTDEECVDILSTIRGAAPADGRVFVCELVVPDSGEPHLGKLMDIHMMVAVDGRERTEDEYEELLDRAGLEHTETHRAPDIPLGVIEASVS